MPAGRLHIDSRGQLQGPANITWNAPFPCRNGNFGDSAPSRGLVQHTMVGNLSSAIEAFNNPAWQASAFFGIDQQGRIHQFGPVGAGWEAWAQVAGNRDWYSCEFADDGNPDNPMTDAQLTAGAQVLEALSAFAGFPLQVTSSPAGAGLGVHNMGGQAWGGHSCPDLPPKHVRSSQRAEIIARAKAIRSGQSPTPPPSPHPAIPGEIMLLNKGKGANTPVAIPEGASSLRFLAADSATLGVAFHGDPEVHKLSLSWGGGSQSLARPKDVYAALVTRQDNGTSDVCVVAQ